MAFQLRWLWSALGAAALVTASASAFAQDQDGDGATDEADVFPCDPRYSALGYAPAQDVSGTLLFEDAWPGANDHDYNDLVLAYNYVYYLDATGKVGRVVATYTPRAIGGKLVMGLGLHLPYPASAVQSVTRAVSGGAAQAILPSSLDAELTVDVSNDLRELLADTAGPINALSDRPRQDPQSVVVDVVLSTPQPFDAAAAPHDVFVFHSTQRGHELHRPMFSGTARMDQTIFGTGYDASGSGWWFVDSTRIPSALDIPISAEYPLEQVEVLSLFPHLYEWAVSSGAARADFYAVDVQTQFAYRDSLGRAAPPAAAPHQPTVDFSCVATPVVTQTNTTIDASNIASIQGSDWTVPNGVTVTIDYAGPVRVYSLDLGGTIRPAGCTTSACSTLDLQVVSDATIRPSGRLVADGLGYMGSRNSGNGSRGKTRGNVNANASYQTGGSHGGLGGRYGATVATAYDSADHPSLPGSGGTGYNSSDARYAGGNGGGVIRLSVGGRLTVDGLISADGGRGGVYDVGGAGGAIWVDAAELASSASGVRIRANGAYGYYAGGGGGRVAVYGSPVGGFAISESTVSAAGGTAGTGGAYYGGPGTIVHGDDAVGQANLLVHAASANNNSGAGDVRLGAFGVVRSVSASALGTDALLEPGALVGKTLVPDAEGASTFVITQNTASAITVTGTGLSGATAVGRTFYVKDYEASYASVRVAGAARVDAGYLEVGGAAAVESSATLDVYDVDADVLDISGSSRVTVYDVASRRFDLAGTADVTARNVSFTTASIGGSATLHPWSPTTSRIYPLTLTGADLSVASSARIHADGLGYLGSRNAGNGVIGKTSGNVNASASYQTGGSHGGHGGRYGSTVASTFGDLYAPTSPGSGGTGYNSSDARYVGGNGGGVLRVILTGTLQNDGRITAHGGRGGVYDTGGAGGSVWITAATVGRATSGVGFAADGAYGYYAGGGGGRVAIEYQTLAGWAVGPATVTTFGGAAGTGGAYYGGPGTILYKSGAQPSGHLLVHASSGFRSGFSDTLIGPSAFDHVTLSGDSHVDATSLQVTGTLRVQDTSTLDMVDVTANAVDFAGGARVYGTSVLASQVTLQGTTLTTLQSLDAGTLDMTGSSVITGWAPTTSAVYPLLVVAGTFDLGASARVHVDGLGYLGSRNAGNGAIGKTVGNQNASASYQTGGSHGGYGGRYGSTVAQQFGDLLQPVTAGAGGTGYNSGDARYIGGNGGGVLRIDVAGTFTLDGRISANGGRGGIYDTGGAGGSVWVNAGTIATNSSGSRVQAVGAYGYYAGGGGGRVALYYSALAGWVVDASTVQVDGGTASTGGAYYGGSGTILHQPAADARPSVLITAPSGRNSGYGRTRLGEFGKVAGVSGGVLTSDRPLRPGALAGLTLVPDAEDPARTFTIVDNTASAITVQGSLSGATTNGARWYVADYVNQLENLFVEGDADVELGYVDVANLLRVQDTSDVLATGVDALAYDQTGSARVDLLRLGFQVASLSGSARLTARTLDGADLSMQGSSVLTGWAPSTSAVYPILVMATNLTVGSSARIDAVGLGYLGSRSSGNGAVGKTDGNVNASASYQTGGSHGGLGGRYGSTVTPTYGDPAQPVSFGAGGTGFNSSDPRYVAGNGGGVVRIDVPGTFRHDGTIDAGGGRGGVYDTGGAGGSVWVTAGQLDGAGAFRADGAYGYYAGGGGGRVAVHTGGGAWAPTTSNLRTSGGSAGTGGTFAGQAGSTHFVQP